VSRPELLLAERAAPHRSARTTLRIQTAAVHEALHVAAPFAAIADRQATIDSYASLLLALHAFHTSMAEVVARACEELELADLHRACERRRSALAADLATAGIARPADAPAVAVTDAGWAVGCLYTLVGSTLGGKLIYRQLDYLLAGPAGREFFAGAADDGEQWRTFCLRLELFAAEQHSLTPTVQGAHFAFEHFASCLDNRP